MLNICSAKFDFISGCVSAFICSVYRVLNQLIQNIIVQDQDGQSNNVFWHPDGTGEFVTCPVLESGEDIQGSCPGIGNFFLSEN